MGFLCTRSQDVKMSQFVVTVHSDPETSLELRLAFLTTNDRLYEVWHIEGFVFRGTWYLLQTLTWLAGNSPIWCRKYIFKWSNFHWCLSFFWQMYPSLKQICSLKMDGWIYQFPFGAYIFDMFLPWQQIIPVYLRKMVISQLPPWFPDTRTLWSS